MQQLNIQQYKIGIRNENGEGGIYNFVTKENVQA